MTVLADSLPSTGYQNRIETFCCKIHFTNMLKNLWWSHVSSHIGWTYRAIHQQNSISNQRIEVESLIKCNKTCHKEYKHVTGAETFLKIASFFLYVIEKQSLSDLKVFFSRRFFLEKIDYSYAFSSVFLSVQNNRTEQNRTVNLIGYTR